MKNQTLKDLYSGSLIPVERQIVKGSEMAAAMDEMVKAEELLTQNLSPELKAILKRLTDAQSTITDLIGETYYIDGFKTGARLMMNIQDESYENLEPVKAVQEDSPALWCVNQSVENDNIICLAHLAEGRVFNCPYKSADERLQYVHACSDYKEAPT